MFSLIYEGVKKRRGSYFVCRRKTLLVNISMLFYASKSWLRRTSVWPQGLGQENNYRRRCNQKKKKKDMDCRRKAMMMMMMWETRTPHAA